MKKIELIYMILGVLVIGVFSASVHSQQIDLLSFNRFTIPVSFNGVEQLSSKTVFYSDFTSHDQPKRVFFQQALQRNVGEWGPVSLSVQLLYRRYNLLPVGSKNEYRPVQVIGYAHNNAMQFRQRLAPMSSWPLRESTCPGICTWRCAPPWPVSPRDWGRG